MNEASKIEELAAALERERAERAALVEAAGRLCNILVKQVHLIEPVTPEDEQAFSEVRRFVEVAGLGEMQRLTAQRDRLAEQVNYMRVRLDVLEQTMGVIQSLTGCEPGEEAKAAAAACGIASQLAEARRDNALLEARIQVLESQKNQDLLQAMSDG